MNAPRLLLNTLESLLVKEFRVCQSLHALARQEWLILLRGEIDDLSNDTLQKQALLQSLSELEQARQDCVLKLQDTHGLQIFSPTTDPVDGTDLDRGPLTPDPLQVNRLHRLQEGILAQMEQIRELTLASSSLLGDALQRANELQEQIPKLWQPSPDVRYPASATGAGLRLAPTAPALQWPIQTSGWTEASPSRNNNKPVKQDLGGSTGMENPDPNREPTSLSSMLSALVAARDALRISPTNPGPGTVYVLDEALKKLDDYLENNLGASWQLLFANKPAQNGQIRPGVRQTNLVEIIAGLHSQERTNRVILQMSSRMLVGA
jgi:flagellar biosynthesis/type III secretory pathway chaperone